MAENDQDLDLDVKSGSKLNTILLVVLIVLVLAVAGVGAALYFMGDDESSAEAEANGDAEVAEEVAKPEPKPAHYLKLEPEFVINFEDTSKARYLQLQIQLMAREPEVLQRVENNMPLIRNELLILLSGQTFDELSTGEGKNKLRAEVLQTVNKALELGEEETGIEQVYFTSLIMQ